MHGNPDHYRHVDRAARTSNAQVIYDKTMIKEFNGKILMLGPRLKGVRFTTEFNSLNFLSVGETIEPDGMCMPGIKATQGELVLMDEHIGWGALGFDINLAGKQLGNLGDTLPHTKEWQPIKAPDVQMTPICSNVAHNTLDKEAPAKAVNAIQSKRVIPCHYNSPGLFFEIP